MEISRCTDVDLLAAARAGDQRAFTELVERHKKIVSSFALALTNGLDESDEVAQETFILAWRGLSSLRRPEHFRPWLLGIARNAHRQHLRMRRRRGEVPAPEAETASSDPSPLDRAISSEEERLLQRALAEIPRAHRAVLVLYYREQQSIEKVAEALRLSVKTVTNRLWVARKQLAERLLAVGSALARTGPRKDLTALVAAAISLAEGTKADTAATRAARRAGFGRAAVKVMVPILATVGLFLGQAVRSIDVGRPGPESTTSIQMHAGALPTLTVPQRSRSGDDRQFLRADQDVPVAGAALETTAMSFDFEDGVLPPLFLAGHVVTGPPRPGNRYSLAATLAFDDYNAYLVRLHHVTASRMLTFSRSTVLGFEYFLVGDDGDRLRIQFGDADNGAGYCFEGIHPAHGKWQHVDLPLRDFTPCGSLGPASPIQDGDSLRDLTYYTGNDTATGHSLGKPFFLDNVRVVVLEAPQRR